MDGCWVNDEEEPRGGEACSEEGRLADPGRKLGVITHHKETAVALAAVFYDRPRPWNLC